MLMRILMQTARMLRCVFKLPGILTVSAGTRHVVRLSKHCEAGLLTFGTASKLNCLLPRQKNVNNYQIHQQPDEASEKVYTLLAKPAAACHNQPIETAQTVGGRRPLSKQKAAKDN